MIVTGCNDTEIKARAVTEGMKTLKLSGLQQVINGNTTLEELQRVIDMRQD
jgi:type II secretory ATPase GspE/PulE/Tfp pilus assembly ATPase PilB-like protein